MEKCNWVLDIESLNNFFCIVAIHYKSDEKKEFVVHALRNDFEELLVFLDQNIKNKEWHITFNGLGYDSQQIEHILKNRDDLKKLSGEDLANAMYKNSNQIISRQEAMIFQEYSERYLSMKHIDVFALNHWGNPAKMSSLKWIQYTMDWHNIQEMPIHHSSYITTMKEIDMILGYCENDVLATKNILYLSKEQINLRRALTNEFGISLYNASEPKIARELFLHFLSKAMDYNKYDLRKTRTNRSLIKISDIVVPYIRFTEPEFKKVHEDFLATTIDAKDTKGGFKTHMIHKGVRSDFGLGGIHGAKDSGVFEAREGMIIMSSDVVSFYPRLAMVNEWAPAHIPKKIFCEQYQWFFDERMKLPKKDPKNYVYKIVLNSTFGLSIDKHSFLYDPQFGMQITINGQLSLLMLYEMLSTGIQGSLPIMQNTDGLEMLIPSSMKEKYMEICAEWEKITALKLEHDEYQKIFLGDVNNYIALFNYKEVSKEDWDSNRIKNPHYKYKHASNTNQGDHYYMATTKCKGRFEFKDLMLHKNKSFLIIPKAIYNYFIHSISPEATMEMNQNIFDYCGGAKAKGDWKFQETCVMDGAVVVRDLQKVTRYYVSKKGAKMVKVNKSDGRKIQVEAGKWLSTAYNKHDPDKTWDSYDIDKEFYLNKIYKEIANIKTTGAIEQLQLF